MSQKRFRKVFLRFRVFSFRGFWRNREESFCSMSPLQTHRGVYARACVHEHETDEISKRNQRYEDFHLCARFNPLRDQASVTAWHSSLHCVTQLTFCAFRKRKKKKKTNSTWLMRITFLQNGNDKINNRVAVILRRFNFNFGLFLTFERIK